MTSKTLVTNNFFLHQ